ncbi:hypothetical protein L6164_037340 [Bauhinia variegata]|uniref:Uncharacterized protein n=1 Tax=Bauhinia variegata TaxID=167791 RepID=A0ACB9KJQ3_BAUVA|nr:hypothetical protein L6164_037340 [Bauhinia variegata]
MEFLAFKLYIMAINLRPPPNAVMVNTCDQLEFKSNVHRVFHTGNTTRISLVSTNGPSPDKLVSPAPELVDESHPPAFAALAMREYYELHQSRSLDGKTILDQVRI